MDEFNVPRFCPEGCGETIIATPPTPEELKMLTAAVPGAIRHWHIKCSKCNRQSWVSNFN